MITYKLKINYQDPKVLTSDMEFVTGDVGAYRLECEFYDNGQPAEVSGLLLSVKAKRADGAVFTDSGEMEGGKGVYVLKNEMYAIAGGLYLEIALSDSAENYVTAKIITANVLQGLAEGDPAEDDVSVYVTLLSQMKAQLDEANALIDEANELIDEAQISFDEQFAQLESELSQKADKKTSGGGFVGGNGASASSGGAAGNGASSEAGGAVGNMADTDDGFAGGNHSKAANGGGAAGANAKTNAGGAVGLGAMAYNYGGAVGNGAVSGEGFSGGYNAKAATMEGYSQRYIDAIQLGTGTNQNEKTLQVYNYQLMDADGKIPSGRMPDTVMTYRGEVISYANLPAAPEKGDVYSVLEYSPNPNASKPCKLITGKVSDLFELHYGGFGTGCHALSIDLINANPDYCFESSENPSNGAPGSHLYKLDGTYIGQIDYSGTSNYIFDESCPYAYGPYLENLDGWDESLYYDSTVSFIMCKTSGLTVYSLETYGVGMVMWDGSSWIRLSPDVDLTDLSQKADKQTSGGGFAGGEDASAEAGGAVGEAAQAGAGFAGGQNATTSLGAALGYNAKTVNASGSAIDAVQLGTGTNQNEKTLQVYGHQLMDANGKIPNDRLSGIQSTTATPEEIEQTITDETGLYYVTAETPYVVYHKKGSYYLYQIKIDGEAVYTRRGEIQRYGEHVWDGWKPYATEQYVYDAVDEKLEAQSVSSFYVGDGALTNSHFSNLGYMPKLVLISPESNTGIMTWHIYMDSNYTAGYYAPDGSATCEIAWASNGFTMTHASGAELAANEDGVVYNYIIYK